MSCSMKGVLFNIFREIEAERGRTMVGGEAGGLFVSGTGPHEDPPVPDNRGNVPGEAGTGSVLFPHSGMRDLPEPIGQHFETGEAAIIPDPDLKMEDCGL